MVAVVVFVVASLVGRAEAQSLSNALSSAPKATQADADAMRERATEAFLARGTRLIDERLDAEGADSQADRATLRDLLDRRLEDLRTTLAARFDERRMDGMLTESEATDVIGWTTESSWASFEEALEATVRGKGMPPQPSDFDEPSAHAWAMARYTLTERNGVIEYVILASSIAGGVLLAWFCSRVLTGMRSSFRERGFEVLGSLVYGLRGPLYLTMSIAGLAFGVQAFWLPIASRDAIRAGIELAFVGATFWLAWSIANLAAQGLGWMLKTTYREPDRQAVAVIRKGLQLLVLVIFAFLVAELVFGVELQSVVIGVGLFGLALTLAAQDSLKNLFGSLTIVIDHPFRVGDLIRYNGFFGWVEDIGFRSTKVREFDGHLVTIPNAHLVREPVQNVDARPWIRRRFRIGLRYDTPPDKVREAIEILEDILTGRDDEPERMPTHIVFEGFGESSLNLLVQYCIEPGEYWDALKRGSDLHMSILDRFNDAGIEFAFPTVTNVIETDDAHAPEFGVAGSGA